MLRQCKMGTTRRLPLHDRIIWGQLVRADGARRPPHCGISTRLMSALGHFRRIELLSDPAVCPLCSDRFQNSTPQRIDGVPLAALMGALIAPWRVGRIPTSGGGPIGRPGKGIWSAKAPEPQHLSPALIERRITAVLAALWSSRTPAITGSVGVRHQQRDHHETS